MGLEGGGPNNICLVSSYLLGIFIAVKVTLKQLDNKGSSYLQNILLLYFTRTLKTLLCFALCQMTLRSFLSGPYS